MKNILYLKKVLGYVFLSLILKISYSSETSFVSYLESSEKFHFTKKTLKYVQEVFNAFPSRNFVRYFSDFDTIVSGDSSQASIATASLVSQCVPKEVIGLMKKLRNYRWRAADQVLRRKRLNKEFFCLSDQGRIEDADRLAKKPLYMDVDPSILSSEYKGFSERSVQEIRYLLSRDFSFLSFCFKDFEASFFRHSLKRKLDTYLVLETKKVGFSVIEMLAEKRVELLKQDAQEIVDFGADETERLLKSLA